MVYLRRNRPIIMVGLGTGLMATSILWEYTRMQPNYRFIIEPWSMRGFETPQGWVVAITALMVLTLSVLVTTRVVKENLVAAISMAAATTAVGVVLAVVTDPREVTMGTPGVWALGLLTGLTAGGVAGVALPGKLTGAARTWSTIGVFVALSVISSLAVFAPVFSGTSSQLWVIVLVGLGIMDVLVVARPPRELAAYRLMINAVLVAWLVALVMSGSLRTLLATRQVETIGLAAEARDIQITSGVMIAWFGGLLAFAGTVSLWAKRRDQIEAVARARRQLDAARRSAEEMGKTLEESQVTLDEESLAGAIGGPTV